METKVFKVEILKPINYSWSEFSSIVNQATYKSARLANEVMLKKYLLAKGEISKNGSFCKLISGCKELELSGNNKCAICRIAQLKFNSLARNILRADITLPSFKNNTLYIRAEGVKLQYVDDEWVVRLSLLPMKDRKRSKQPQILLRTIMMRQRSPGYYQILERIANGTYKLGFTQLKRDKARKKLYLLMSYSFEPVREDGLNPNRVMGVDLGVATPAYCAFNDSLKRKNFIVEGKSLLRMKRQIEARRRDIRKEIDKRDVRRGHGLANKFAPLNSIEEKWINFRRTWNHVLARRIVEYALAEKAGVIHLEDLSPNGDSSFLGKHWPVAELLNFIEYKAKESGIKVERIDPYKTSQTCSRCGVLKENFNFKERTKRGFPSFVCDSCGFQDNADYNAAKSIARLSCRGSKVETGSAAPSTLKTKILC